MFIELTEIVTEGIGSLSNPERNIVINTSKIQTFYKDSSERTVIELRRSSVRVKESYEEVKELLKD
jgi:hypothetical protein|tara:strand:+ start:512 stop:709 length:198 start_codon:yes stop_codon:yes gene_type:complete